ncbi:hypothetical protein JHK87_024591 [Glycine soja]|nr:hypothetical protein JHK87_024591 [Glycine soja]
MGLVAAAKVFEAHRISTEEFRCSALSIIKNENLVLKFRERYLLWKKAAPLVLGMIVFGLDLPIEPKDTIPVGLDDAVTTTIGFASPNKANSYSVHGSALGAKEVDATMKNLRCPYEPFHVPEDVKNPVCYMHESGITIFALQLGTKNKPMYGIARSLQDMLDSRIGLSLVIHAILSSSFKYCT